MGAPTTRVREVLWAEVRQYSGQGRALLAYKTDNEQGFSFETHDHGWHPIDHEGLTLIHRPARGARGGGQGDGEGAQRGWSKASKRRRFGGR